VRTQSAIQQGNEEPPQPPQPQVQQGGSSSSGVVRNVAGGILSGAGSVARGVASFLNPFGGEIGHPTVSFQTLPDISPEASPQTSRERRRKKKRASPVQSGLDEAVAEYESDALS